MLVDISEIRNELNDEEKEIFDKVIKAMNAKSVTVSMLNLAFWAILLYVCFAILPLWAAISLIGIKLAIPVAKVSFLFQTQRSLFYFLYNVILVWISLCIIHTHEHGHAISILSTSFVSSFASSSTSLLKLFDRVWFQSSGNTINRSNKFSISVVQIAIFTNLSHYFYHL